MRHPNFLPFLICFILFATTQSAAQSSRKILEEAESLIAKKQYNSAFKLLMQKDPENNQPDLVVKKVEIALDFYASSIMHQIFGFADLETYEDIYDVRGKQGKYELYAFNIGDVLDSLIHDHPDNYSLIKARGDYYYEVYLNYGNNWIEYETIVLEKIREDYLKAVEKEVATYQTFFTLGYIELKQVRYISAISYFLKSIEKNRYYAPAYYNLAYTYLNIEEPTKAAEMAAKAMDLYEDKKFKADAARMIAIIHKENKNFAQALKYYEIANETDPDNYIILKQLLQLELNLKHKERSVKTVESFYRLGPANPTIYNDLMEIYIAAEEDADLIRFFNHKLANKKKDPLISANLYFYLAEIYLYKGNKKEAAKNYILAKENFVKVFDANDNIFKIIESNLVDLK